MTEQIKGTVVNAVTGEVTYEYYTEKEWAVELSKRTKDTCDCENKESCGHN